MSDLQNQNPLDKTKVEDAGKLELIYKETDKQYLTFLQTRLERAKEQKDQIYPELNNQTLYQVYEGNEKIANTMLEPKKNEDDVIVSAGTVEAKLDSLLSHINNLNLSPEVFAFDKNNRKIVELGQALEDIIHDTEIRDGGDGAGDEEKRMERQRELLKQGTVFVQEEWLRKFEIKKKLKEKYKGEFKEFAGYTEELVKVFEGPSRTLLYSPNVYLGDITKFYMDEQPYVFVNIITDYESAKAKYGKFENFKYVRKGNIPSQDQDIQKTIFDNKWQLSAIKDNEVEIQLYQDKIRDEFQIIIGGVLMLPIGFPLSAVSPRGEYNIAKQVYRIINSKFAYGKSFVASGSVKEVSALIDEMLKLMVLKTRKSFTPAYVNTSGRVINKKVLSPGRISMGIDPNALVPIAGNEVQGITAGESNFLEKMESLIDKSTVSEQFTGQQGKSGTTATEVVELQRQAKLTLGLTVGVCTLLEKKLAILRLYNILENWFEPTGEVVDDIREELVKSFRSTSREVSIDGEGMGERSVALTEGSMPTPKEIRNQELIEERQKGIPVRKLFLKPSELKKAELFWYVVVNAKERESSPFYKAEFRQMLADLVTMTQFGSVPNKDGIEEELASMWKKPRNKMFQNIVQNLPTEEAAPGGRTVPPVQAPPVLPMAGV